MRSWLFRYRMDRTRCYPSLPRQGLRLLFSRIHSPFPQDLLDPWDLGFIPLQDPRMPSLLQTQLIIMSLPRRHKRRPCGSRPIRLLLTGRPKRTAHCHPRPYPLKEDTQGPSPADRACRCRRRHRYQQWDLIHPSYFLNYLCHPH
jgi:hypothetical protein